MNQKGTVHMLQTPLMRNHPLRKGDNLNTIKDQVINLLFKFTKIQASHLKKKKKGNKI